MCVNLQHYTMYSFVIIVTFRARSATWYDRTMDEKERISHEAKLSRRSYLLAMTLGASAILEACSTPDKPPIETNHPDETDTTGMEFESRPAWEQRFADQTERSLDTKIWHYDTDPNVPGYNREQQAYTDRARNVRVEPGVGLIIEAHQEPYTYPQRPGGYTFPFTSGRVDTRGSFTFTYGKLEARIKVPAGEGVWPAFWLLSTDHLTPEAPHLPQPSSTDEDDPRLVNRSGEIDIMEFYGSNPGNVEGTVHTYRGDYNGEVVVQNASEAFHTYGVEITPTAITWRVDNHPYFTFQKPADDINDWPFTEQNSLYVILNLAMGGTGGGTVDTSHHTSWPMVIEHLAYYKYTPSSNK